MDSLDVDDTQLPVKIVENDGKTLFSFTHSPREDGYCVEVKKISKETGLGVVISSSGGDIKGSSGQKKGKGKEVSSVNPSVPPGYHVFSNKVSVHALLPLSSSSAASSSTGKATLCYYCLTPIPLSPSTLQDDRCRLWHFCSSACHVASEDSLSLCGPVIDAIASSSEQRARDYRLKQQREREKQQQTSKKEESREKGKELLEVGDVIESERDAQVLVIAYLYRLFVCHRERERLLSHHDSNNNVNEEEFGIMKEKVKERMREKQSNELRERIEDIDEELITLFELSRLHHVIDSPSISSTLSSLALSLSHLLSTLSPSLLFPLSYYFSRQGRECDVITTLLRVIRFNTQSLPMYTGVTTGSSPIGTMAVKILTILPTVSRVNHSCTPNCTLSLSVSRPSPSGTPVLQLSLITTKEIILSSSQQNEELTMSYLTDALLVSSSQKERENLLSQAFRGSIAQCGCAYCTSTRERGRESVVESEKERELRELLRRCQQKAIDQSLDEKAASGTLVPLDSQTVDEYGTLVSLCEQVSSTSLSPTPTLSLSTSVLRPLVYASASLVVANSSHHVQFLHKVKREPLVAVTYGLTVVRASYLLSQCCVPSNSMTLSPSTVSSTLASCSLDLSTSLLRLDYMLATVMQLSLTAKTLSELTIDEGQLTREKSKEKERVYIESLKKAIKHWLVLGLQIVEEGIAIIDAVYISPDEMMKREKEGKEIGLDGCRSVLDTMTKAMDLRTRFVKAEKFLLIIQNRYK